jgi:hypothetical protein
MEDVPVLGIATRCDAVGLFLLEHLQFQAIQQRERCFAFEEGDAGPVDPAVARSVPLPCETAAIRQRFDNSRPELVELLRFA